MALRIKVILLTVMTLFFLSQAVFSFATEWEKQFGGNANDGGTCVQQTNDGGYIITGYTMSADVYQALYLVKTDGSGALTWAKTFGGSYASGLHVEQTTDDGFIITGWRFVDTTPEIYLLRTDASGNKLWEKGFKYGENVNCGVCVQQTTDGGFIVLGYAWVTNLDIHLIKTDASGNKLWEKTIGGSGDEEGSYLRQTTDGGFIIVGSTTSYGAGYHDIYLVKTDASGNKLWEKTFGSSGDDWGRCVQQTSDGGYIVSGDLFVGTEGQTDGYLIKTDASGNKLWEKTFGNSYKDSANSIQQTMDGGYVVTGTTTMQAGDPFGDLYFLKTDAEGNDLWRKTFGGPYYDEGWSVQETTDGGFIAAGYTYITSNNTDVYMVYYRPDSSTGWESAYSSLFNNQSDLALMRQYRDQVLGNSNFGKLFTKLLYENSAGALQVLLDNPSLMTQATSLLAANKKAVAGLLNGNHGVIQNTAEVVAFLDAYAEKSPPALKNLVEMVKTKMVDKKREGEQFLGFTLQ